MMKIAVMGSTGSIGTNALEIIARNPERFEVVGLAAGSNVESFAAQIKRFKPRLACLATEAAAAGLSAGYDLGRETRIVFGPEGMDLVAALPEADVVVAAIAGSAGLLPTLAAVKAGKIVALANKESLVMAGELLTAEARRSGGEIVPVDSEHSAVFQLLAGQPERDVKNIILTASGGPFLHCSSAQLERVGPAEALNHPRWEMGRKVTIDSATLMNKGLEVIEAHWLFGFAADRIKVVIHPQSIIHSMVEFVDGSVFAQLSQPDMKGPIAYAFSRPERLAGTLTPLNFAEVGELTFSEPDLVRFPALDLAYQALREGGLMPAVMNAANEVAVHKFIDGEIGFCAIARITEKVMQRFNNSPRVDLDSILGADRWARREAQMVSAI